MTDNLMKTCVGFSGEIVLALFTMVSAQSNGIDWKKVDTGRMDAKAQTELFQKSRESLASDPYRPLYHFSPPRLGLHDAAGLCWWKGKYHLFSLAGNLAGHLAG